MTMKTKSKNYFKQLKALLKNSVANFSGVKVAAIIVTDKGIFKGVNYEDPVLNLGMCAERNAIFNGITNGMKHIKEIHLTSNLDYELNMCAACRQVASNFMNDNDKVFVYLKDGTVRKYTLKELLPHQNKKLMGKI